MLNQFKILKEKWYSVTDKLAVNASVKHGESQANMFCDNGVSESPICGWLKDKEKLDVCVWLFADCLQHGQRLWILMTKLYGGHTVYTSIYKYIYKLVNYSLVYYSSSYYQNMSYWPPLVVCGVLAIETACDLKTREIHKFQK